MSSRPLSTKKILRKTEMWVLDSYFEKGLSSGSYKQGSYVEKLYVLLDSVFMHFSS